MLRPFSTAKSTPPGSRSCRKGRSLPANWSWSAFVAVTTTVRLPEVIAGTRYASVLPVPVPPTTKMLFLLAMAISSRRFFAALKRPDSTYCANEKTWVAFFRNVRLGAETTGARMPSIRPPKRSSSACRTGWSFVITVSRRAASVPSAAFM